MSLLKTINECPNYEISISGDVWNKKTKKKLKPFYKIGGYQRVMLTDKESKRRHFSLHRLVATTFISNPNNLPQVNHIDGNKSNNHMNNLEWVTSSLNQKHAYRLGLQKPIYGENHHRSKLKDRDVEIIMRMLYLIQNNELNLSQHDIAKIFGLSVTTINDIKQQKHRKIYL